MPMPSVSMPPTRMAAATLFISKDEDIRVIPRPIERSVGAAWFRHRNAPPPGQDLPIMSAVSRVSLLPIRMASRRLANNPLADIHGLPMIVEVWRRAMEADIGPVFVAAGEPEIVTAVEAAGGKAVLTDPDHPSGSHRIFYAVGPIDPVGRFDVVVNVPGGLPTIR